MSSIPSGMENASCNTVAFLSQKIMEKLCAPFGLVEAARLTAGLVTVVAFAGDRCDT